MAAHDSSGNTASSGPLQELSTETSAEGEGMLQVSLSIRKRVSPYSLFFGTRTSGVRSPSSVSSGVSCAHLAGSCKLPGKRREP
eukprot:828296-Pleurochrysis_carterae.AAC.7